MPKVQLRWYTFKVGNSGQNGYCLPSEKGSTLKGKKMPHWEQILSFWSIFFFQRGLGAQKSKQELTKVVSLVKMAEKSSGVSRGLNISTYRSNWTPNTVYNTISIIWPV